MTERPTPSDATRDAVRDLALAVALAVLTVAAWMVALPLIARVAGGQ